MNISPCSYLKAFFHLPNGLFFCFFLHLLIAQINIIIPEVVNYSGSSSDSQIFLKIHKLCAAQKYNSLKMSGIESLQKIKQQIANGNLELARANGTDRPDKVEFEEVEKKVAFNNRLAEIAQSLSILSWEEKYEWVNIMKLKGNKYYSEKNYSKAIEVYLDSLVGLDFSDQNRISVVKTQLQYPILLNIATCYYQLQDYTKGVQICDKILADGEHPKCLFKKGVLLVKVGDHQKAKQCLDRALQLNHDPHIRQNILSEYKNLKLANSQQKQVFKKMLEQDEEKAPLKANVNPQQSQNQDEEVLNYEELSLWARAINCLKNFFSRRSNQSHPRYD